MKKLSYFLLFILASGNLITKASVITSSKHKVHQDSLKQANRHIRHITTFSVQPVIVNAFVSNSISPVVDAIQYTRGSGTLQGHYLKETGQLSLKRGYKTIFKIQGLQNSQIGAKIIEDWKERQGTIDLKYIADHLPAQSGFELFYGIGIGIKYEYIHALDQTLRLVDDKGNQAYFHGILSNDQIRAIITKANESEPLLMTKLPISEFVQHSDLSEGYGLFNKEKGLRAIYGFNRLELSNKNDPEEVNQVYLGTFKETFPEAFSKTFGH